MSGSHGQHGTLEPVNHDLWAVAAAGFAAGLAIAMPLGAIAVLILRESMVRGRRFGLAAGAGVATVDLVYCGVAVAAGASIAPALEPYLPTIAVVSGLVIIAVGAWLLRSAFKAPAEQRELVGGGALAVYGRFIALTAVNPATVVYFLALSAVVTTLSTSPAAPWVFVTATGVASLLWQGALAFIGAAVGARISDRASRVIGIVAACVVMALGVVAITVALVRG